MLTRITRGLLRLWLVLSVCWIIGVGVVLWPIFPPSPSSWPGTPVFIPDYVPGKFNPDEVLARNGDREALARVARKQQWKAAELAAALALVPPALVLVLGASLIWVARGFR
jgi:hypothetical protein